ncbi:hypothetical protein [Paenibacillus hubeiensis]|uniref:hypothetical protein n=1 Tax=Paenibacillus hubeiensis TaxID=3077330 RepID=UPI0031B9F3C4
MASKGEALYLVAQRCATKMRNIISIEHEIAAAAGGTPDKETVDRLENEKDQLLQSSTLEELVAMRTVMIVGESERGRRLFPGTDNIEIIHLPIELSEHELMEKYSRYLAFKTREELFYVLSRRTDISICFREGMDILKL